MDKLIRNIDDEVFMQLTREAREKNISLNDYINGILKTYTLGYEVASLDEKYRNLVKDVIALYDHKNERIEKLAEENHYMLKSIIDALEED